MIPASDRHGIRLLRIEHGKVNALDIELLQALQAALETARDDQSRAVILTGSGRVFSAGVDLFRVLDGGDDYLEVFLPALSAAIEQLFTFPRPLVAAIDGHAIAGGCVLACAADLRLAAAGTGRIGLPELRVGVPFPAAALEVVRYAVGDQQLPELVLTGSTYGVDEAQARGLVNRVVPADELLAASLEAADELAAIGPAFELSKQQLRHSTCERIAAARHRQVDSEVLSLWRRPSTLDAIRAYLEKTVGR